MVVHRLVPYLVALTGTIGVPSSVTLNLLARQEQVAEESSISWRPAATKPNLLDITHPDPVLPGYESYGTGYCTR